MPRKNVADQPTNAPRHGPVVHPVEFDQYAPWMALSKRLGEPPIQGEMAISLGANPDTLPDWKKRDDFREHVKQYRKIILRETIPDIRDAAIRAATRDRFDDRKLLLDHAEEYLPLRRTELTGKEGGPLRVQTRRRGGGAEREPPAECVGTGPI